MGYKSSLQYIVKTQTKRLEDAEFGLRELQKQKQDVLSQMEQEERNWELVVKRMKQTGEIVRGYSQQTRVAHEIQLEKLEEKIREAFLLYREQKKKVDALSKEEGRRKKEWEQGERRRKEKEIEDLSVARRNQCKKEGSTWM